METIKSLIGSRDTDRHQTDQPLAAHADQPSYDHPHDAMIRGGDYGVGKESRQPSMSGTPLPPQPRSLKSIGYGRLDEHTSSSHPTVTMADLQQQIDQTQPMSSSTYSTPTAETRQMQTVVEHEHKYPPIVKEKAVETESMGKGGSRTNDFQLNQSKEPMLKIESIYTGSMRTAYGQGFSEGYKQAISDIQGHAGKGVIEYPNPSVYKILTEQKEGGAESSTLPISNLSAGVGKVGKKTKSFFIRLLEKAGCASEADHDVETTMEKNAPTKKYPDNATSTSATTTEKAEAKRAQAY